jgi:hypothetical protein
MNRLGIPRIALFLAFLIPIAGMSADDDAAWIADKSGCKVANPFPQSGESITWSGQCKNGTADGEGILQWYVDGNATDRYEGTLVDGWAEGKGTLTRADGGRYAGEWKHSLQDGDGRYDGPDGSWYEGQWKEGQPHGHGKYKTADGRLFVGEWVNGVYEGDTDSDDNPNRT